MLEQPTAAKLAANPMLPARYRIKRIRHETKDTFTLDLDPLDGDGPFCYAPGQFNMLYIFGIGEVPISISGSDGALIRHTTRAVGTVTKAMRDLKRGAVVGLRGPFGSRWPIKEATGRDVVIAAGGIGLAPLRSALYQIMAHRSDYGRVTLLYGARTPEDILFRHELEQWRGKFDLDVYVTVDRAASSWRGMVGVVTKLVSRAGFDPAHALAMMCGPEVMMRFTMMELQKRGVATDRIYLSMERNMKCAMGFCGHCMYGPVFICKDGPIFPFDRISRFFSVAEV